RVALCRGVSGCCSTDEHNCRECEKSERLHVVIGFEQRKGKGRTQYNEPGTAPDHRTCEYGLRPSRQREDEHAVTALEVQLVVTTSGYRDVLLAVDHVGRRW